MYEYFSLKKNMVQEGDPLSFSLRIKFLHSHTLRFMKRLLLLLCFAALFPMAAFSDENDRYIEKWAATAVMEMHRSGIPASITLAQGLVESRAGLSELATEGNNHFGIKCHSGWTGEKMYHDDDARGECFRVYSSAEESFRDHSDFLRGRQRYAALFKLDVTDYRGWAEGLSKAGYATSPTYASQLIKVIEDYRLYEFDVMNPSDFADGASPVVAKKLSRRERKRAEKAVMEEASRASKTAQGVPQWAQGSLRRQARKAERRSRKAAGKGLDSSRYSNEVPVSSQGTGPFEGGVRLGGENQ